MDGMTDGQTRLKTLPFRNFVDPVIKMRAFCFDTDFVSQMKLTELPLIHCFVYV